MIPATRRVSLVRDCAFVQDDMIGTCKLQVLNVAYLVVGGLCTFIGATGYYMYGTAARDLITFNLPAVRMHLCLARVVLPALLDAFIVLARHQQTMQASGS